MLQCRKGLQMHTLKKKVEKKKKFMPTAAEAIHYLLNWGNLSPGPSGRARLGSQAVTQRSPWRGPADPRSLRQWLLNSQCRSTQVSHLCPTHTLVTVNTAPTPIPFPHRVSEKEMQSCVQNDAWVGWGGEGELNQKVRKCSKKDGSRSKRHTIQ